ncbi:hypothetical protein CEE37_13130 [candidate division LCP-89 bacterium B3_LCP]|uniref:Uncharacterized protein n=1 Tax=candidate division LCP-89 bacterium B3_LCP TaxID=2012998 RepID=A0A532UU26_UNCL8|nr:MAG: hypothetical protein CEE37_13130 [candidate division LCP-89 bacterium B3_LCP]
MKNAEKNKLLYDDVSERVFATSLIELGIAYSQVRQFLGAAYYVFFKRQDGDGVDIKQWEEKLNEPDFNSLVSHELRDHLNNMKDDKREVHVYRNLIIHGAKFPGKADKIFKLDFAERCSYWSDFHRTALSNDEILVERLTLVDNFTKRYFQSVNRIWEILLSNLLDNLADSDPPNKILINSNFVSETLEETDVTIPKYYVEPNVSGTTNYSTGGHTLTSIYHIGSSDS